MNQTMLGPGIGPYLNSVKAIGYNRTGGAVVLGDILMIDHLNTQAEGSATVALFTDVGGDSAEPTKCWPWGNFIAPATTGIGVLTDDPGALLGVVTSLFDGAGADNKKVEITIVGYVTAKMAGATTYGADLYPANAATTLTTTQTDGVRCLAKALGTTGGAGSAIVFFNGILAPGIPTYLT